MTREPKQPIDRGAPASIIADKFGGLSAFCQALTEADPARTYNPSTVHRWLVKGYIDPKYQPTIYRAAELRKVKIKAGDWLDLRTTAQPGSAPTPIAATA